MLDYLLQLYTSFTYNTSYLQHQIKLAVVQTLKMHIWQLNFTVNDNYKKSTILLCPKQRLIKQLNFTLSVFELTENNSANV